MEPDTTARIYPSLGEQYSRPSLLLQVRLALTIVLLAVSYFVELSDKILLLVLLVAAVISGYDIVINAVKDCMKRDFLHENLTVSVAVIASFAISRGTEGVVALLLLQISYIIRDYALFRTRKTICEVIEPDRKLFKGNEADAGAITERSTGTMLTIFEGMAVPSDCLITEGSGAADLSFTTGSDKSVRLKKGDFLPAGSVCTVGQFKAEITNESENALFRKIAAILKSGYGEMTETEEKWTKAVSFIPPLALAVSFLLMLVLPLIFHLSVTEAIRRVITIIAVASPCGILLSVPLTMFSGIALARRLGIVFSHAKAVENASLINAVVFNKVGTLTERTYLVTDIKTDKMDPATFLKVAAYASANSENYLAKAIVNAYGEEISKELVHAFVEHPNQGLCVAVDQIQILLGYSEFLEANGVSVPEISFEGTVVHMSVNGIYAGRIILSETIMQDASRNSLNDLAEVGADRIAMISGDRRDKDRNVANELGIEEYYAECSTEEKVQRIAEIKGRIDSRSRLAFVGDGECDVQMFVASDVGIMINGLSSHTDLAKTDVAIMENGIGSIPSVIRVARRTMRFAVGGILFCCLIKALIIVFAALGYVPIWFGLLIDSAASFAVLLNCTRICARNKTKKVEA
ncbi:MAG: HAD-IC family P-type ATPase [Oscillospiraceae bacterium]|nr:HAD-IC family P-type ATPase [Oscillospiraceae bacterium]